MLLLFLTLHFIIPLAHHVLRYMFNSSIFGWKGGTVSGGVLQWCDLTVRLVKLFKMFGYKGFSCLNSLNCRLWYDTVFCIELSSFYQWTRCNVCYECKCIFFQILYTIVIFMKSVVVDLYLSLPLFSLTLSCKRRQYLVKSWM